MTVALGTTLIDLSIDTLLKKGVYARIEDAITDGTDIFIGALVTRFGQTFPDIDLCAEIEAIFGQVVGINTSKHPVPDNGPWYNDYDNKIKEAKQLISKEVMVCDPLLKMRRSTARRLSRT